MNMLVVVFAAFLGISLACEEKGLHFYRELGCKPTAFDESNGCALAYSCPEYKLSKTHCNYNGKLYSVGEKIPIELTQSSCQSPCQCKLNPKYVTLPKDVAGIECEEIECESWPRLQKLLDKACRLRNSLDACCRTVECPPFNDTAECKHNGKTYKSGEKFTKKNSCVDCVCDENFALVQNPSCKPKKCGFEKLHAKSLANRCAPLYVETEGRCCPKEFVCESSTDVYHSTNRQTTNKCHFGSKFLNYGDYFERPAYTIHGITHNIKCTCEIPPYLTCIDKYTFGNV